MAGEDLLGERHRARRPAEGGRRGPAREAPARIREEAARLDHAPRHGVLPFREEGERDLLAAPDPLEDGEIRRDEQPEVDRVLPVNALEALRDKEMDSGGALGVRGLLARGALPAPPPGHRHGEVAAADGVLADGSHACPALGAREAEVRVAAERLVVVEADPARRDLVRRDLVPKGMSGIVARPRQGPRPRAARASGPASSVRYRMRPSKRTALSSLTGRLWRVSSSCGSGTGGGAGGCRPSRLRS